MKKIESQIKNLRALCVSVVDFVTNCSGRKVHEEDTKFTKR
jgi:hypothetical protein